MNKLSIIIPVYNEKNTILKILQRIKEVDLGDIEKEIVIIDDYSIDGTREILKEFTEKHGYQQKSAENYPSNSVDISDNQSLILKVIYHNENLGKGSAIRTGIKYITGDIVLIQDADLEYDPQDYQKLIQPILDGEYKVVYGSRNLGNNKKSGFVYYIGGRFLSTLANLLYGTNITDEPTCYKVFKADVLKNLDLKCGRFEFCPEVTAKVARQGIKIHELPISYQPRSVKEGKKIKFKDAVQAAWTLIKYKFKD